MEDAKNERLVQAAMEARERAYAPYSGYKVGAALLGKNQKIYLGCNVENVSFGATLCAERNAFSAAVCDGELEFEAMAICASGKDYCYPCGICRQFMSQFSKDLKVIILNRKGEQKVLTLSELFPYAFDNFDD